MRITLCMLAASLLLGACRAVDLPSRWRDGEIAVDGRENEWVDQLTYVGDLNLGVAAQNDATHLYLCLVAQNRRLQTQVLRRGLTVWIDPGGGKKKRVGIRFPLDRLSAVAREGPASEGGASGGQPGAAFDAAEHPTFELLLDGRESGELVRRDAGRDVEIGVSSTRTKFVYELKLPLHRGGEPDLPIDASPASWIGVGLETASIEPSARRRSGPRPDQRPGQRSPRDGGGGPSSPGWPGGSDPFSHAPSAAAAGDPPEPPSRFEVWTRVRLAAPPAPATR